MHLICPSNMDFEQTIDKAKVILADMNNISIKNFEHNVSRVRDVVEARRMLCYFMCMELEIQYNHVKHYIPAIKNHATAIHHVRRYDYFLSVEPHTQRKYDRFTERIYQEEFLTIEKEIQQLVDERVEITKQLKKLRNIIKIIK